MGGGEEEGGGRPSTYLEIGYRPWKSIWVVHSFIRIGHGFGCVLGWGFKIGVQNSMY